MQQGLLERGLSTHGRRGDTSQTGDSVAKKLQELSKRFSKFPIIFRFSLEDLDTRLGQKVPRLNMSWDYFILGIAIVLYTIVFSYFTILRHWFFQSSAWDLGIYMQSLYTTGFHGRLLGYTVEIPTLNPSGSFLGIHFSPFLFLLVPLYRLFPFAETLLILQSLVLALGSFGLYWLSKHLLENKFISISLAMAYLLYTPLQTLNWFDFHPAAFIPLFFFLMFYFYVRRSYMKSLVFFVLILSTIEIMPVLLFPFGLYCLISDRKNKKALMYAVSILIVSAAWFLLASLVKSYLNPNASVTFSAWQTWGNSYQEIIINMITKPINVVVYFFTVLPLEKVLYFLWLIVPLLFLPLFARKEFILLAMPWIVLVFLSSYPGYFTNSYAAFVAPQVFVAAIYGIKQVTRTDNGTISTSLIMRYGKWILWATVITFILVGPFGLVPQTREIYVHGIPEDSPNKEALRSALQVIPANASVFTSFRIASHLANRLEVYSNAIPNKPVDYIIVDLKSPDASIPLSIFGDSAIFGVEQLLDKYNYTMILSNDGILVYKNTPTATPTSMSIAMSFDYRDLTIDSGSVLTDNSSQSKSILVHEENDPSNAFWHGPYIALPRGTYEVTYTLKADEIVDGQILTLDVTSDSGQTTLARKYVYGHDLQPDKWNNITLSFSLDSAQVFVEFRGTYASNATAEYLDMISVKEGSSNANHTFGSFDFNYEDLSITRGADIFDGILVHANDYPEPLQFGLAIKTPPGVYRLDLWLKIDARTQGSVFALTINDFNSTNLGKLEISSADFAEKGSWQAFSIDFSISNSTSLIEITGLGDQVAYVSFSYLELKDMNNTISG